MSEIKVSVIMQGVEEMDGLATGISVTDLDHFIKILRYQMLEKGKDVCGSVQVYDSDSFRSVKTTSDFVVNREDEDE